MAKREVSNDESTDDYPLAAAPLSSAGVYSSFYHFVQLLVLIFVCPCYGSAFKQLLLEQTSTKGGLRNQNKAERRVDVQHLPILNTCCSASAAQQIMQTTNKIIVDHIS